MIFPLMELPYAFGISFVFSIIGIIFVRLYVFETKGRDLERIMRTFSVKNLKEMQRNRRESQEKST